MNIPISSLEESRAGAAQPTDEQRRINVKIGSIAHNFIPSFPEADSIVRKIADIANKIFDELQKRVEVQRRVSQLSELNKCIQEIKGIQESRASSLNDDEKKIVQDIQKLVNQSFDKFDVKDVKTSKEVIEIFALIESLQTNLEIFSLHNMTNVEKIRERLFEELQEVRFFPRITPDDLKKIFAFKCIQANEAKEFLEKSFATWMKSIDNNKALLQVGLQHECFTSIAIEKLARTNNAKDIAAVSTCIEDFKVISKCVIKYANSKDCTNNFLKQFFNALKSTNKTLSLLGFSEGTELLSVLIKHIPIKECIEFSVQLGQKAPNDLVKNIFYCIISSKQKIETKFLEDFLKTMRTKGTETVLNLDHLKNTLKNPQEPVTSNCCMLAVLFVSLNIIGQASEQNTLLFYARLGLMKNIKDFSYDDLKTIMQEYKKRKHAIIEKLCNGASQAATIDAQPNNLDDFFTKIAQAASEYIFSHIKQKDLEDSQITSFVDIFGGDCLFSVFKKFKKVDSNQSGRLVKLLSTCCTLDKSKLSQDGSVQILSAVSDLYLQNISIVNLNDINTLLEHCKNYRCAKKAIVVMLKKHMIGNSTLETVDEVLKDNSTLCTLEVMGLAIEECLQSAQQLHYPYIGMFTERLLKLINENNHNNLSTKPPSPVIISIVDKQLAKAIEFLNRPDVFKLWAIRQNIYMAKIAASLQGLITGYQFSLLLSSAQYTDSEKDLLKCAKGAELLENIMRAFNEIDLKKTIASGKLWACISNLSLLEQASIYPEDFCKNFEAALEEYVKNEKTLEFRQICQLVQIFSNYGRLDFSLLKHLEKLLSPFIIAKQSIKYTADNIKKLTQGQEEKLKTELRREILDFKNLISSLIVIGYFKIENERIIHSGLLGTLCKTLLEKVKTYNMFDQQGLDRVDFKLKLTQVLKLFHKKGNDAVDALFNAIRIADFTDPSKSRLQSEIAKGIRTILEEYNVGDYAINEEQDIDLPDELDLFSIDIFVHIEDSDKDIDKSLYIDVQGPHHYYKVLKNNQHNALQQNKSLRGLDLFKQRMFRNNNMQLVFIDYEEWQKLPKPKRGVSNEQKEFLYKLLGLER